MKIHVALTALALLTSPLQAAYLDRLNPVLELRFDKEPALEVELADGIVLKKSANFPDSLPKPAPGPHPWTGKAWDFRGCRGGFYFKTDERHVTVGDIDKTDGMTISFWCRGRHTDQRGRTILFGPFWISAKGLHGLDGGGKNYTFAKTGRDHSPFDNKWHHVVVRVDFRTRENNIQIYIDGEAVAAGSAHYTESLVNRVGRTWWFGSRGGHKEVGFDYGPLANVAVFDRPLTENEINYIYHGPVYAGKDQQVVMPNGVELRGLAYKEAEWKQISGPAPASIEDSRKEKTSVEFPEPGDYTFQLMAGTYASEISINVLPNQPPKVLAGNGQILDDKKNATILRGELEDSSVPDGQSVTSEWSVLLAPENGSVKFATPDSPVTNVTLSGKGLFTLRLTATDGEKSAHSDVNVLVPDGRQMSYVQLLRPLFFMGFEEPARTSNDPLLDDIGGTAMKIRCPENGMPVMKEGARSYTGYAWDFSVSDSDLEVINGDHFIPIYDQKHPGRSLSVWIKTEAGSGGHISSFWGNLRLCPKYGIFSEVSGIRLSHRPPQNIADGQWHHLAEVATTRNGTYTRKLYLDGNEVAKLDAAIATPWWSLGDNRIVKSKFIASRGRVGKESWKGQLDDFAVFDYAVTPDDVAYLYNGPSDADRSNLKLVPVTKVEAGRNHTIQLPGSYKVQLEGSTPTIEGLKPRWRMVSGNGQVSFSDPDGASTVAMFEPVEDDKDGKYTKFVLRLSLVDHQGRELAGDNTTVLFHPARAPEIRTLTETPPPGEHPRVFFTKADLPELRRRAEASPVAKRAVEMMRTRSKGLDNPDSVYQAILADRDFSIRPVWGSKGHGFFTPVMEAAYVNWLGEAGQTNTEKMQELARVFSEACQESLTWYRPNYYNVLCHDVIWPVGIAYDLLHDYMDEAGRAEARHLISRMTSHRYSKGPYEPPQGNATNHRGSHDHIFATTLAIEGEEGFDEGVIDCIEKKDAIWLTQYGIFESGLPHEGYAYFNHGMSWMSMTILANTRRKNRENLAETTRFYRAVSETPFRLLDKDGIRSHHDVVEDTETGAGLVPNPPNQIMIAKYLWPEDRTIDYVWAQLSENLLKETREDRFGFLHAVFAEPVRYPDQTMTEAAGTLNTAHFCPDRGFMNARNSWDEDSLRLNLRCRMDKYYVGHVHSDCNAFELWGRNRMWFMDRGKFGGTIQEAQSGILIDGIGAHSANRNSWPSFPGRFLEFKSDDVADIACGDAKPFYDWARSKPRAGEAVLVKDHGLKWSDFYFPRNGERVPEWMEYTPVDLDGYGNAQGLYKMNPVKRAFRTAALVKGEHPFVLIVDDFQKDDQEHEYTWFANVPWKGSMEVVAEEEDSLILKHKEDAGGPFLLVKVLHAKGLKGIELNRNPNLLGKEALLSERVEISTGEVLAPDFRVLLYPYEQRDPQPKVSGRNGALTITIGDQVRSLSTTKGTDGRTRLNVANE